MTFVQSKFFTFNSAPLSLVGFKTVITFISILSLVACGGGGSDSPTTEDPLNPVTEAPSNQILSAYFRDQDSEIGKLSGIVTVEAADIIGDYALFSPCFSYVGEALDVKVNW
jgi:vibriolysin